MKIAVCTLASSPTDVKVWSGTPAHFIQGLNSAGAEVVPIGPLHPATYRLLNKFSSFTGLIGKKLNWETEPAVLRMFTRRLDAKIAEARPDVVIVMGWFPLCAKSEVPIIYWGDATVGQRIDVAPHWSRLSARTRDNASRIEAECLTALAGTFWASQWARKDAIERYKLENTSCVPFASNLADPIAKSKQAPEGRLIRLLAVGVKWHRKGMDTAVTAADELIALGHNVHLDVVGVHPPDDSWMRCHVTYHGLLRKDLPADVQRLHFLYEQADLFVLPTRNEPFGIVFQEAAAYALPVVTSNVGGVPEIVENELTGITLDEHASPKEYAAAISQIVTDSAVYASMSQAARARYTERFTWNGSALHVLEILKRFTT
ncbi:glycosyltransferase family 4 protein [Arthrobacter sp. UYEF21]|uniref:glycosyltransferase family 4 protein n=1 Tax=Arthrobacter sp. UYEF21 TaxID=1756364 RepID=UPI0033932920